MLVAVSRIIKNKPSKEDFESKTKRLNATFENLDLTASELGSEVAQGHAFCAQHGSKWRNKENFLRAGFLAADIDDGMRIEDALNRPFVEEFGALIYTSPSHTPENHRFRIVFELEEPITDMLMMEQAYTGLIRKFGADKSCKDACRMFYGSEGAKLYLISGSKLPKQEVDSLVIRGQEILFTKTTLSNSRDRAATVHSRLQIDPEVMVVAASGVRQRLVDFPADTQIHCPVHEDRHPSAFTLRSKSGTPGLHCITCQATYFITSEGPYYDFDYELRVLQRLQSLPTPNSMVRKLDEQEYRDEVEHAVVSGNEVTTQRGMFTVADIGKNTAVSFISEPFLPEVQTDADVILIKSPKGSGKTEWLKQIVLDAREASLSVLLIGHRQSLIMSTAKRLGLTAYIQIIKDEKTSESRVVHKEPDKYFAICVDSLPLRLDPMKHKYDIVLIDEVEQVLAHLTAETLRDNRHDALMLFSHYLQRSKKIYALDADLNRVTGMCIPELLGRSSKKTAFVVVNEWRSPKGNMSLYEDKAHLIQILRDHVAAGKRCFVCANSKAMVRRLTHMLADEFGSDKKLKTITSDNSQTSEAQDFLLGLPATCLEYDCILVSPAVGTGVDITFPNGESKIDTVLGFFGARVNTHFDIDQQLCRVRHPGSVHVWVSPEKFSFSTYPQVIRTELVRTANLNFRKVGYEEDGTPKYSDADRMYATIFGEVIALRRGSKNNFLENFCNLRRRSGWDIVTVPRDEDASQAGKELNETAVILDAEARHDRILLAPPISKEEYKVLVRNSKRGSLSSESEAKKRRYEIERFYLRPVSKELVEQDDDGAFRDQIRMFELLGSTDEELDNWWIHLQRETRVHRVMEVDVNEERERKRVLIKLFSTAGVYESGAGFNTITILSQDSLPDFIHACRSEKVAIERLLEISLRRDLGNKASRQLGVFLGLVGLSLEKAGTKREPDGSKTYFYKVDAGKLARVQGEVDRRKDPNAPRIASTEMLPDGRVASREMLPAIAPVTMPPSSLRRQRWGPR